MRQTMMAVLFGVLLSAGTAAAAADLVQVRIANPSDRKWNVEVRDMVCDGKVLYQGRMVPGQTQTLRLCAGADGTGAIRATVAGGCASAKATDYEGLAGGAEVAIVDAD